jgi:hypothetical protein
LVHRTSPDNRLCREAALPAVPHVAVGVVCNSIGSRLNDPATDSLRGRPLGSRGAPAHDCAVGHATAIAGCKINRWRQTFTLHW